MLFLPHCTAPANCLLPHVVPSPRNPSRPQEHILRNSAMTKSIMICSASMSMQYLELLSCKHVAQLASLEALRGVPRYVIITLCYHDTHCIINLCYHALQACETNEVVQTLAVCCLDGAAEDIVGNVGLLRLLLLLGNNDTIDAIHNSTGRRSSNFQRSHRDLA